MAHTDTNAGKAVENAEQKHDREEIDTKLASDCIQELYEFTPVVYRELVNWIRVGQIVLKYIRLAHSN
jgi:hypothetical protein